MSLSLHISPVICTAQHSKAVDHHVCCSLQSTVYVQVGWLWLGGCVVGAVVELSDLLVQHIITGGRDSSRSQGNERRQALQQTQR
jgi:hypothetical protein